MAIDQLSLILIDESFNAGAGRVTINEKVKNLNLPLL